MKIVFADSFWKSLKKLSRQQTWWYKTYEVFRYDIPMFFENLWFFRKQLWEFRSWDYTFNLQLLSRSLEKTVHTIEFYGHEVDSPRLKKVEKIKRVIQLLKNVKEDVYIDKAESELGELKNLGGLYKEIEDTPEEREHNSKVFARAREIQEQEWKEIWEIFKGQNKDEFDKIYNSLPEDEKNKHNHWDDWFDGSGMYGWWD